MSWSREEILAATGGKILRAGTASRYGEIATDSSKVKRRSIFVALKGARLDGHSFINAAARRGADCFIVHRKVRAAACRGATVVKVANTLRALGELARYRREKYRPMVLAITGSNGKTTTKEMLAAILERAVLRGEALRGKVLKTDGNFNNLVGLPLTLLRLRKIHKVAVVELGTNHPGEIRRLTEIAEPDMGIITSVAAAHLEGLNSLAGVAREKGALYRGVRKGGAIAVNLDDPWVRRLGAKFKGKRITYGNGGHVRAESCRLEDALGMRFTLCAGSRRRALRIHYLGQHNVTNALGAAALARGLGVGLSAIGEGLQSAEPFPMRMQIENWKGIGIINDAYNANPASMAAAVAALAQIGCARARIAVLGDMFELGAQSRLQHLKLGKEVARARVDALYLLGAHARHVRQGALRGGMAPATVVIGRDHADLARRLAERLKKGDWLLCKGSRGMTMEKVLEALKKRGLGQ